MSRALLVMERQSKLCFWLPQLAKHLGALWQPLQPPSRFVNIFKTQQGFFLMKVKIIEILLFMSYIVFYTVLNCQNSLRE